LLVLLEEICMQGMCALGVPAVPVAKTHRRFFLCSQSGAGSSPGPFLSSGDQPSQSVVAMSIPQAWVSTIGGYRGQSVL
jgi:hypothetical protein